MYGGKSVSYSAPAIRQRKVMAGAAQTGNFGVGKSVCPVAHPDASMSHTATADSARGTPPASGGRQAAPDHAQSRGMSDHFSRNGKL
jgi:hypothetical protein